MRRIHGFLVSLIFMVSFLLQPSKNNHVKNMLHNEKHHFNNNTRRHYDDKQPYNNNNNNNPHNLKKYVTSTSADRTSFQKKKTPKTYENSEKEWKIYKQHSGERKKRKNSRLLGKKKIKLLRKKARLDSLSTKDWERGRTRQEGTCIPDICLNQYGLISGLINNQVSNSLNKRIKRFENFEGKLKLKLGKKEFINQNMEELAKSLGGFKTVKDGSPYCRGRYNTTEGFKGAEDFKQIINCTSSIQEACSLTISNADAQQITDCKATFQDIMADYTACLLKDTASQCDCFQLIDKLKDQIKSCNKKSTEMEKLVNNQFRQCGAVFNGCKKLEDASVRQMSLCKTTKNNLELTLEHLYYGQDIIEKMMLKATYIFTTNARRNNRSLRQQSLAARALDYFIRFTNYLVENDPDNIASDSILIGIAQLFVILDSVILSDEQTSQFLAANAIVTAKYNDVLSRVKEVKTMITTSETGSEEASTQIPEVTKQLLQQLQQMGRGLSMLKQQHQQLARFLLM